MYQKQIRLSISIGHRHQQSVIHNLQYFYLNVNYKSLKLIPLLSYLKSDIQKNGQNDQSYLVETDGMFQI